MSPSARELGRRLEGAAHPLLTRSRSRSAAMDNPRIRALDIADLELIKRQLGAAGLAGPAAFTRAARRRAARSTLKQICVIRDFTAQLQVRRYPRALRNGEIGALRVDPQGRDPQAHSAPGGSNTGVPALTTGQTASKPLRGDRVGQYCIRVNDQSRICFRWTAAGPEDVEAVDYH